MKNASEIVKSINVSMAIEWGKQAWSEVSQDTIVKCFKMTRLYPQALEEDDDPFEGEDKLPALQELMDKVGSSCDAEVFIFAEDNIDVWLRNIDKINPNWRNDLREQVIDDGNEMSSAPAGKEDRTNEEEEEDGD